MGVIKEDVLGLDVLYIQAKKWEEICNYALIIFFKYTIFNY